MPRSSLALLVSLIWSGALGACLWAIFGLPLWPALAVCAAVAIAAVGLGWGGGILADRRALERARVHAAAAGVAPAEVMTGELLMARLAEALEQASTAAAAFTNMRLPALVADPDGRIVAVSRGLKEIAPGAAPGGSIDAVYGEGFLATGGGAAEQSLVALGGRRFEAHVRSSGTGRNLITLSPAGYFVTDDDLDAFALAVADGRTAFRFTDASTAESPVLQTLNGGLDALDQARIAMGRILAGQARTEAQAAIRGDIGIRLRALDGEMKHLRALADTEAARRKEAETRLAGLGEAVEACRSSIAALREVAAQHGGSAGAVKAGQGSRRGRARRNGATSPSGGGLEAIGGEIDAVASRVEALDARLQVPGMPPPEEASRCDPGVAQAPTVPADADAAEAVSRRPALSVAARRLRHGARQAEPLARAGTHVH